MFALDSNVLIHALKGKGRVRERLAHEDPSNIGIPSIVSYELEFGTLRSVNPDARRRELRRLLSVLTPMPFDDAAAGKAAILRLALEQRGVKIGPLDTLIAAIAISRGAILVTHNTAEFSRVPGLRVEDWYD